MDDISKLLETMRSLEKYLSWAVLVPCFFTTTALLLIFQIFPLYIILEPMYTTIRITTAILCLLSFCGLLYKGLFELCTRLYRKVKVRNETIKRQEHILEQIRLLSKAEQQIFNYVRNGNSCGVWVCEADAAVQTLLYKGLLQTITDKTCFADWPPNSNEQEICILTIIPKDVIQEKPFNQ